MALKNRTIYARDCLDVLSDDRALPDSSIDLIYLDPPFNSKSNYNLPFKGKYKQDSKAVIAFKDTWTWNDVEVENLDQLKRSGDRKDRSLADVVDLARRVHNERPNSKLSIGAYLLNMAIRLKAMRRVLKDNGSIYLHCDPTASHYLKLLMDTVWGAKRFKNEITWKRKQERHNLAKKRFGSMHDVILYYGNNKSTFNQQFNPYDEDYIERHYKYQDMRGRYTTFPCTNERGGNKIYEFNGISRAWRFKKSRMQEMYDNDLLTQAKPHSPFRYKKYLSDAEGVAVDDMWLEVSAVRGEELDYPTKKPITLLERIIETSSNVGDFILDPFCGCGTTVHAAEKLNRNWMGIDISQFAAGLIKNRLIRHYTGLNQESISIIGVPNTVERARALFRRDPFEFEKWACGAVGASGMYHPPGERGADGGIDGVIPFYHQERVLGDQDVTLEQAIVQVKGGKVTPDSVRALSASVRESGGKCGVFICFDKYMNTVNRNREKGMIRDAVEDFPFIQGLSVEDVVNGKQPNLPGMRKVA